MTKCYLNVLYTVTGELQPWKTLLLSFVLTLEKALTYGVICSDERQENRNSRISSSLLHRVGANGIKRVILFLIPGLFSKVAYVKVIRIDRPKSTVRG